MSQLVGIQAGFFIVNKYSLINFLKRKVYYLLLYKLFWLTTYLNWISISISLYLNRGQNIIKYCVITSAADPILIAVNTFLISQKSTKNAHTLNIELKNYQAI